MNKPNPPLAPLAWTLVQFRTNVYPMSRAKANNEVQSGRLKTYLDGGKRMVTFEDGRAFADAKAAAGGAVDPIVSAAKSAAGKKGRAMQLSWCGDGGMCRVTHNQRKE